MREHVLTGYGKNRRGFFAIRATYVPFDFVNPAHPGIIRRTYTTHTEHQSLRQTRDKKKSLHSILTHTAELNNNVSTRETDRCVSTIGERVNARVRCGNVGFAERLQKRRQLNK